MGKRKIVDWLLKPLGLKTYRLSEKGIPAGGTEIFGRMRQTYFDTVVADHDYRVQAGPFKGMKLNSDSSWGDGDLVAKFFGAYELETFDFIKDIIASKCDCIVNIGAAEGYYAVAMKRQMPKVDAYTYDIDPESPDKVLEMSALNDVKVVPLHQFSFAAPGQELETDKYSRIVFLIDCEGAEVELVDMPKEIIGKSDFLIELHDQASPGVQDILVKLLSATHNVTVAQRTGRDPLQFELLKNLSDVERAGLLCEFRSDDTPWMYATLK